MEYGIQIITLNKNQTKYLESVWLDKQYKATPVGRNANGILLRKLYDFEDISYRIEKIHYKYIKRLNKTAVKGKNNKNKAAEYA